MIFGLCAMEGLFGAAAANGFSYIELPLAAMSTRGEAELTGLRQRAAQHGLTFDAFNGFFPGNLNIYGDAEALAAVMDAAERNYRAAELLGGTVCVVGGGSVRAVPKGMEKAEALKRFTELFGQLGDAAARHGLVLALEPLRHAETTLINTVSEGLEVVRAVDRPNVGCLVDFFHFFCNGEPLDELNEFRPGELRHVHMARPNVDRLMPTVEDAPVMRAWADKLREIGYNGRISLECCWPAGVDQGLVVSRAREALKVFEN